MHNLAKNLKSKVWLLADDIYISIAAYTYPRTLHYKGLQMASPFKMFLQFIGKVRDGLEYAIWSLTRPNALESSYNLFNSVT